MMRNSKVYTKDDLRGISSLDNVQLIFKGIAPAECASCKVIYETYVEEYSDGTMHTPHCSHCREEYLTKEKMREGRNGEQSEKPKDHPTIYDTIDLNHPLASKIDKVSYHKILNWMPSQIGMKFNLYLRGESGAGKSTALHHLIKKLKGIRRTVLVVNGAAFWEHLQENGYSYQNNHIVRRLKQVEILAIDEFAKGFTNAFTGPILFDIINSRIERRYPTLLASRYNAQQINEIVKSDPTIGEDLVRRIRDYFEVVTFRCPSLHPPT